MQFEKTKGIPPCLTVIPCLQILPEEVKLRLKPGNQKTRVAQTIEIPSESRVLDGKFPLELTQGKMGKLHIVKGVGTIYLIYNLDEPKVKAYEKLIDYALGKSDAFMLVTARQESYADLKNFKYSFLGREEFENEMHYQRYLKSCEKIQEEMLGRAQIFEKSTKPYLEKLQPYLIKVRNKPEEWPSTMCGDDSKEIHVDINTYKVCREVRSYLLEPAGLFHWLRPFFPEDLCFFKDGYCWLSSSAHESFAEIYIDNEDEVESLKTLGLKFKCEKKEIQMFYEDYSRECVVDKSEE
ncbi:hypothetical protein [Desulfosporosinus shakirovi]|uniref:hypothetical protein n=1 Tax=Desulfosporosinus shakirovi TaxID=2885154 RepID=UPI001E546A51|nr:hypothetical protein [Desulfosporosinus sp. SRJS8]MCB8818852.1 hypothetical protein [Desulfosporosinus sp. SRJS8]